MMNKININALLIFLFYFLLFQNCSEPDISKELIGIWEVKPTEEESEDYEEGSLLNDLSSPPKIVFIDKENLHLTFFLLRSKGKYNVSLEKKIIYLDWNEKKIQLAYNLEKGEITMILGKGRKIVFHKTSDTIPNDPSFLAEDEVKITSEGLKGTWDYVKQIGGNEAAIKEFMYGNKPSTYSFGIDNYLELVYEDGKKIQGKYFLRNDIIDTEKSDGDVDFKVLEFTGSKMKLLNSKNTAIQFFEKIGESSAEPPKPVQNNENTISEKIKPKRFKLSHSQKRMYKTFREKVLIDYDKIVNKFKNRKNFNKKVMGKILEDLRLIKENETLSEFIEACPRIEPYIVDKYFEGFKVWLGWGSIETN